MPKPRGRALVIDADAAVRRGLARALAERDIEPLTAEDGAAGLALLHAQPADVALVEVREGAAGLDAARAIARERPGVALVLLAAVGRVDAALQLAWELGAGVLHKPIEPPALAALFAARAIDEARAVRETQALADRVEEESLGELAGVSAAARAALRLASEAARTAVPVLVLGEEGTGRDRLARLIHDRSRRASRGFVSLSCAALAGDADVLREGVVDAADRGTLFLDGIEELPIAAQDRLLSLLSRGELLADVRVVAGTALDLRERVRAGTFREELFYRLRSIEIRIAPLRDRVEDVPLLAYAFLRALREETGRDVRRISPEALRLLRHHPWPGNARELRSVLAHAVALARGDVLFPSDLPFSAKIPASAPEELFDDELAELPYVEARRRALTAFERRYTRLVLGRESGNLSGAARRAGMDRSNFKRLLRRTKG
jgi:DNA-binding NtrC family response regulator